MHGLRLAGCSVIKMYKRKLFTLWQTFSIENHIDFSGKHSATMGFKREDDWYTHQLLSVARYSFRFDTAAQNSNPIDRTIEGEGGRKSERERGGERECEREGGREGGRDGRTDGGREREEGKESERERERNIYIMGLRVCMCVRGVYMRACVCVCVQHSHHCATRHVSTIQHTASIIYTARGEPTVLSTI